MPLAEVSLEAEAVVGYQRGTRIVRTQPIKTDAQGRFNVPEEKLGFGGLSSPYPQIRLVVAKAGLRGERTIKARDDSPVTVVLKR